jgi:hypothetical protein
MPSIGTMELLILIFIVPLCFIALLFKPVRWIFGTLLFVGGLTLLTVGIMTRMELDAQRAALGVVATLANQTNRVQTVLNQSMIEIIGGVACTALGVVVLAWAIVSSRHKVQTKSSQFKEV